MEVKIGPNSVDEPNILYKLQRKIKVFNTNNSLPNRGYNLVASSSKYGIVFVVSPNCMLSAYYLKDLVNKECEPSHVTIKLQLEPTHIAVNCDQEWLALISKTNLFVYKIADFQNQNTLPSFSIKLDVNPATSVSSVQWNPCVTDTIAIAFLDGTLLVSQVNTMQVKKLQSNVKCICWSPKGKQLVTGNNDGTLCQYKPDLSPMKVVPPPNLFEGAAVEALAIFWISTYQFAVVYKNATDNSRPAVTIVNTPKGGQPSCFNYEDICYSMASSRPWYYYLHGLSQWNMILASSSNSMEIATLGSNDGSNWLQWCQPDEARPELPLTNKTQENYPVGICVDTCAIHQLPWGENEMLPPMPLLLVLSQTGLLSIFNIINLKKEAPSICTPLQQLLLPAAVMTSAIPDDVPQPTVAPTSTAPVNQPMPQPVQPAAVQPAAFQPQPAQPAAVQPAAFQPQPAQPTAVQPQQPPQLSANQFSQSFGNANPQAYAMQKSQANSGLFSSAAPKISDTKPVDAKPQIPVVNNPPSQTPPQPVTSAEAPKPQTPIQTQEMNALKNEQERVNKMKANEELKNMLIREVNDFQMELHKFMVKTREAHIKLQRDIESINTDFGIQPKDVEHLKIDCSIEELREAIVQLKLDLVRACAVVAEVRTHTDTKNLHEWSQADPLTMKRVASVKKLSYYVQNQLDQAHRALDHKWNEMAARNANEKPGQRMLRPILDDIYQPLVKQQEILSRQQAVLRSLRNTLKECGDVAPIFKTTTILRSTPFRSKADPLSKLTKNILNMSIEPDKEKVKDQKSINQKLDALRDMLSNHKTVKIKPVNVELKQQLIAMRLNYERSLREKEAKEKEKIMEAAKVKLEPESPKIDPSQILRDVKPQEFKPEMKAVPPITVPTYTPVSNAKTVKPMLANVARTLFTEDESKPETVQFAPSREAQPPTAKPEQPKTNQTVTTTTRIMLKGMLQNKSLANAEKSNANTFMGQNICSPAAFNFSKGATAAPPAVFSAKPIADMSEMLSKLPQTAETGVRAGLPPQSPPAATFTLKAPPLAQSNVPDVLRTANFKAEVKAIDAKPGKENARENSKQTQAADEQPKAFGLSVKQPTAVAPAPVVTSLSETSKVEVKTETTSGNSDSTEKSATSVFSAANAASAVPKPLPVFGAAISQATTAFPSTPTATTTTTAEPTTKAEAMPAASASSIFGKAVASQLPASQSDPKPSSPTGSIFATSATSTASLFGNSSIFGRPTTTTATTASSAQSIFASAATATPEAPISTSTATSTTSPQAAVETSTVTATAAATTAPVSQAQPLATAASPSTTTSATAATTTAAAATTTVATTTTAAPMFAPSAQGATVPARFPVFGGTLEPTNSVFGAAKNTTGSLWPPPTGHTWTGSSEFGGAPSQPSMFGTPTPISSTQSVFGTPTPTSSTQSVFGTPTPTPSTQSAFGTQAPASVQSVFGAPTPSTQTSMFGTPTPSTQASVFGAPTQTQSVFGAPPAPTTTQAGSIFGTAETNLFAAATISTTSAPSPTSGGSIFGTSGSGSVFGDGKTNVFGGKTTFGQSGQSAAAIFGGANSTFQQNSPTSFWGGSNASGGNVFGSSTFGQQATTQASLFRGGSGGSFSAPSTGQPLGSPQPNAFGATEAKPVFGSPQQQTSPAFGGSAVFGTKPVFGQTTGFGSPTGGFGGFGGFNKSPSSGFGASASFGGAPAFGGSAFGGSSPVKMFGGTSPTTGFGAPTQSNSTFETLATQNTLTFGNLAQQSAQQSQPQQPSFNTSPSFTGWRG